LHEYAEKCTPLANGNIPKYRDEEKIEGLRKFWFSVFFFLYCCKVFIVKKNNVGMCALKGLIYAKELCAVFLLAH
jgi:hypothetical protein